MSYGPETRLSWVNIATKKVYSFLKTQRGGNILDIQVRAEPFSAKTDGLTFLFTNGIPSMINDAIAANMAVQVHALCDFFVRHLDSHLDSHVLRISYGNNYDNPLPLGQDGWNEVEIELGVDLFFELLLYEN